MFHITLDCNGRPLELDRARIAGIVNVTPDSFSDGGQFADAAAAIAHGVKLVEEGADLLDVGGESTRPGADPVDAAAEIARVVPVIEGLAKATNVPISIDTSKPDVMRAAVAAGAGLVNDVRALREEGALDVTMLPVTMKRGRPGTRLEVLCRPDDAARLEVVLLTESSTIGVRERIVRRHALPREVIQLTVLGQPISAKLVSLPNGSKRAKPEFADVQRTALATARPLQDILRLAAAEAERFFDA